MCWMHSALILLSAIWATSRSIIIVIGSLNIFCMRLPYSSLANVFSSCWTRARVPCQDAVAHRVPSNSAFGKNAASVYHNFRSLLTIHIQYANLNITQTHLFILILSAGSTYIGSILRNNSYCYYVLGIIHNYATVTATAIAAVAATPSCLRSRIKLWNLKSYFRQWIIPFTVYVSALPFKCADKNDIMALAWAVRATDIR